MRTLTLLTLAAALSFPPAAQAAPAPAASVAQGASLPVGRDWILRTADNICGLRDANQLTQPALLDYDACLAATPEMKKVEAQGIDPRSAEGIQLHSAAVTRLTNAAESVRSSGGYCSIWKSISHKDGRAIPDISSQVTALF